MGTAARIELAELVNEQWVLPPLEKRDWVGPGGSLSQQRARLSAHDNGHFFPRGAD